MTTPTDLTELQTTAIPDDADGTDGLPEYVCQAPGCDRELFYGGRGRKPKFCDEHKPSRAKSTGTGRRSSKDVDTAVNALEQLYSLAVMGLFASGARHASQMLEDKLDAQKELNRGFLENAPELAKRIASVGRTGAGYAFLASQVGLMGPVLVNAYAEWSNARTSRDTDNAHGSAFPDDIPTMMGGVPVDG